MALELQLLGSFMAAYDGRSLDGFRSNKTQALLAYLVTEASFANEGQAHPHGRQHLMNLLWPRTPQKSAQVNLRQTLYQLRRAIPEVAGPDGGSGPARERVPFILSDRKQVEVNPDAPYELDVARFLRLLDGEPSPDELAQAVSLYRGPFLADFHLPDSETFEEWAAGRRTAMGRMAVEALETLATHHLQRGEAEEAERYARRQIALDELRESGHRQLLRALAQQGKRNVALAHYETYGELLEEELGVKPSAEMEALISAVREGKGADAEAPTLAARAEAEERRQGRLPSPASRFIGRRELSEVTAKLTEGCRLLTLLGPGGSGKTRLGIEAARQLAGRYARGATFVDLAPLSDPGAIPTTIATALDFRFSGGDSPREQVLNYLANKELLLVLDNFEHLLDGAELASVLLETAPGLRLLVTSRARLNLGPECLFEVGGLSLPDEGPHPEGDEGDFEAAESVALFLEQARRVAPSFALEKADKAAVARICHLVEGMPLAIELAASWVRYLPPVEIARELAADLDFLESERADLPPRQRSMRAAFDYSWNMLDESEQAALMKLSIFRGGASRQAARAVTGASLRTLKGLADHSLLSIDPDSGRFAIHELIRQFAEERLEQKGAAEEVRDAHSEYYLQALAGRLAELKGRDQLEALDTIEEDFENVRVAWRWAVRQGEWRDFPEASQSLFLFGLFRERYLDGIELFEVAGDALRSPTTTVQWLARAYATAGGQWLLSVLSVLGSHEEALASVPELEKAMEATADPTAVAFCQMALSQVLIDGTGSGYGKYPAGAIAALEEARAYYQQAGEPFYSALVLSRLGHAHWWAGKIEESHALIRGGLTLAQEAGDRFVASSLIRNLGAGLVDLGQFEAAESYLREAAELAREIGARGRYAAALTNLAEILLWRDGDLEKSRPLLEEAHAIAVDQNVMLYRRAALRVLFLHRMLEGRYEEALVLSPELLATVTKNTGIWHVYRFYHAVAFVAAGQIHQALTFMKEDFSYLEERLESGGPSPTHHAQLYSLLLYFLFYAGVFLARQGEHEWAAELLALGLTDSRFRRGLEISQLFTRTRAELEESLGEETFAAAWERGKALDPLIVTPEVIAALEEMEAAAGDDTKS